MIPICSVWEDQLVVRLTRVLAADGDAAVVRDVEGDLRLVERLRAPRHERLPTRQPRAVLEHPRRDVERGPVVHLVERGAHRLSLRAQPRDLREVLLARHGQRRLRGSVAAVEPLLRQLVEEGVEAEVVLLRDRVVLVVVALPARHRQPEERRRGRLHAIGDVHDLILLGDRAALVVQHVVAVEPGGDQLVGARVRQEVAGEHLDDHLVVRLVPVQRLDQPVAPQPHRPRRVAVIAVRVRVARRVEPRQRHALAVTRRREQAVDRALVRALGVVGQERVELLQGRRDAGQVERRAAQQGLGRCVGSRREPLGLQPREHVPVEVVARPRPVGDVRGRRGVGGHERPMLLPLGPLLDPALEGVEFLVGQRRTEVRRRHAVALELRGDAMPELRRLDVAAHDRGVSAEVGERLLLQVETQAGFARLRVGAVAREAAVREDRPHLAREVDRRRGSLRGLSGAGGRDRRDQRDGREEDEGSKGAGGNHRAPG